MKRWMLNVLTVFFAAVFLVSAGVLGKYLWDSHVQKQKQNELSQLVDRPQTRPTVSAPTEPVQTKPVQDTEPTQATQPTETEPPIEYEQVVNEAGETVRVLKDYAEVYRLNNDLVGWIQIPGTIIDYPVMQKSDSVDYYLHRDIYKEYSRHGTIYVREACDVNIPSDAITIYGHRMKDGSMFAGLTAYIEEEFYKENKYIYFDTLTEYHTYEIISVFITSAHEGKGFRYHVLDMARDAAEFEEYVDTCKDLALYETGVTAEYGEKLIVLSTCDYSVRNGRLVVVAKRIS